MNNTLLIQEPPLQVLPSLAREIGVDEAIVLQQVHYWISISMLSSRSKADKKYHDGKWWVFNTYEEWQDLCFPFWETSKIGRIFRKLEDEGLLIAKKFEASDWNQRKWYTIDYTNLYDRISQIETFLKGNTEESTENTTITEQVNFCIDAYKNNISKSIEPMIKDAIEEAVKKHGMDRVIEAIAIAVYQKKKNWAYIAGILNNKSNIDSQDATPAEDGGYDM